MARKQNQKPGGKKPTPETQTRATIKLPGATDTTEVFLPDSFNLDIQAILHDVYKTITSPDKTGSGKLRLLAEINDKMDLITNSMSCDVSIEDPAVLQKENHDYSKINVVKYKEDLFCPERFQKLFTDNDYEIEMINERDFIVTTESGGVVLVRVSKYLPLVRYEIPLMFKARVSRTRKLNFMNEMMLKFPLIRAIMDDDYEYVCAEYNYFDGLYIKQVLTLLHSIIDITYSIYTDENDEGLLNANAVGIY